MNIGIKIYLSQIVTLGYFSDSYLSEPVVALGCFGDTKLKISVEAIFGPYSVFCLGKIFLHVHDFILYGNVQGLKMFFHNHNSEIFPAGFFFTNIIAHRVLVMIL